MHDSPECQQLIAAGIISVIETRGERATPNIPEVPVVEEPKIETPEIVEEVVAEEPVEEIASEESEEAVVDYSKMTVKQLKAIADERGLSTKGLRKQGLVDLLSGS